MNNNIFYGWPACNGQSIDSILIGGFTDHESRREWLKTHAPTFLGDPA
jgi:hypothetical protein